MISTVAYMCRSVLSEHMGTGNDKDEKFLQTIYVQREYIMLQENRTAILHGGYVYQNLYSLLNIRNESNSRKFCVPKMPRVQRQT